MKERDWYEEEPMEKQLSESKDSQKGISPIRAKWWRISGVDFVECPRCKYVAEYLGDEHICPGCNQTSHIELS